MRFYFLLSILFITACMQTPEVPSSNEKLAKKTIEENKKEAQESKNEYLTLQKKRTQG